MLGINDLFVLMCVLHVQQHSIFRNFKHQFVFGWCCEFFQHFLGVLVALTFFHVFGVAPRRHFSTFVGLCPHFLHLLDRISISWRCFGLH